LCNGPADACTCTGNGNVSGGVFEVASAQLDANVGRKTDWTGEVAEYDPGRLVRNPVDILIQPLWVGGVQRVQQAAP